MQEAASSLPIAEEEDIKQKGYCERRLLYIFLQASQLRGILSQRYRRELYISVPCIAGEQPYKSSLRPSNKGAARGGLKASCDCTLWVSLNLSDKALMTVL